jgi:hypothetical protein
MYKVYIGYDSREKIAAEVCKYSLRKNSKKKISIKYLKLNSLRKKKLYTRKEDKLSSTEFTFSRFLVPILNKYNGWAIFCDCDFLWLTDIEELFKLKNDKYAVMCVKHDYKPLNKTKMDITISSGNTLVLLTEAPHKNIISWMSPIYTSLGTVKSMSSTGYHSIDVWETIIFQILFIQRLIQNVLSGII